MSAASEIEPTEVDAVLCGFEGDRIRSDHPLPFLRAKQTLKFAVDDIPAGTRMSSRWRLVLVDNDAGEDPS